MNNNKVYKYEMIYKEKLQFIIINTVAIVFYANFSLAAQQVYIYDPLHRLTRIERSDGVVITYTYDDLGNRRTRTVTTPAIAPVAAFVATPTSGPAPLSVAFTDQSTGTIASWAWDFDNNGSVDATVPSPTHLYSVAGSYTVTLTVNGPAGSDAATKTGYIVVGPVLDADNDTIPDNWEQQWFGDTTTAGGSTDWDRDGYTDLQEYLNQQQAENDPLGAAYDPKTANAPCGTGYLDPDDSFWEIMTPVIINNARSAAPETK